MKRIKFDSTNLSQQESCRGTHRTNQNNRFIFSHKYHAPTGAPKNTFHFLFLILLMLKQIKVEDADLQYSPTKGRSCIKRNSLSGA